MKTFVAIISLALIAHAYCAVFELTDAQKTEAKRLGEECAKELNITEEESAKLKARDYTNATENMKCFAKCFFEKVGTWKEGVLQEDVIIEKFGKIVGEDNARQIYAKCKDIEDENLCEKAFKLHKCVNEVKKSLETEAA